MLPHHEIWKYYQRTGRAHPQVLQNLIVCLLNHESVLKSTCDRELWKALMVGALEVPSKLGLMRCMMSYLTANHGCLLFHKELLAGFVSVTC